MRSFVRIVLFTVIGPYVGLLAVAVLIGSYTLATTGSPRDFVFGAELVSPGILLVAYTVGGIPALVSGIVAIFVGRWLSGWRYWLSMALLGGIISLVGGFALVGGGPEMVGVREQAPVLVLVAIAGAVAALVCAALFDGLARLVRR
jgi:hypothetical protein